MGAAIEVFEGARALRVPRTRFAPVKTTDDLLALRSDAYELTDDARVVLAHGRTDAPFVALDSDHYKLLRDFDERFPEGPPSLVECERFEVEGDVRFGAGVVARGEVVRAGAGRRSRTGPSSRRQARGDRRDQRPGPARRSRPTQTHEPRGEEHRATLPARAVRAAGRGFRIVGAEALGHRAQDGELRVGDVEDALAREARERAHAHVLQDRREREAVAAEHDRVEVVDVRVAGSARRPRPRRRWTTRAWPSRRRSKRRWLCPPARLRPWTLRAPTLDSTRRLPAKTPTA